MSTFAAQKIDEMSSIVFDKNVVEFVTVAAEYCAFIEQSGEKTQEEMIDVLPKLLSLLYLKVSMVPDTDMSQDVNLEEYVSENDYEAVRQSILTKLGGNDDYLEVFTEEMKYSDTPVRKCISEDLADLYQALKNFVESYKSGLNDIMTEAIAVCQDGFRSYWGQTLTNTLRAIHAIKYNQEDGLTDDDESMYMFK